MPTADADDPSSEKAFRDALDRLRDHYGVDADSRVASLDGPAGRVHYLVAGDGPPLLCLHGLGSSAAIWFPALDALAEEFTVYAPDRPGRGLSTPVDFREVGVREFGVGYLVALLDELGIGETAVAANSLGGFQALALAADHPGRVGRLCALGAPAGLSTDLPRSFRLLGLPVVGRRLFARMREGSVADWRATTREMDVVDDSAVPDALLEARLASDHRPGNRESLWSLVDAMATVRGLDPALDLCADLPAVDAPTRFVWGSEDVLWPPSVGREAVDSMPDADLLVLDGHGHVPWLEPGDAAVEAALDFLADGD